ncbi:hypothetical protein [Streptomyces sp. 13-12-16]|uniref:hypothetical protein n=1 Tax=Streptomyces sp. 13-12-16 TaxID=1570823 RepID=UPI0026D01DBE
MDTQNTSVRPHAQSRNGDKNHPSRPARTKRHPGGVTHDNTRHTARFTVIGNHLTQHPDLSLLAIGLACHIQSLPSRGPDPHHCPGCLALRQPPPTPTAA